MRRGKQMITLWLNHFQLLYIDGFNQIKGLLPLICEDTLINMKSSFNHICTKGSDTVIGIHNPGSISIGRWVRYEDVKAKRKIFHQT